MREKLHGVLGSDTAETVHREERERECVCVRVCVCVQCRGMEYTFKEGFRLIISDKVRACVRKGSSAMNEQSTLTQKERKYKAIPGSTSPCLR